MTNAPPASSDAWFKLDRDRLEVGGAWTIGDSARLDKELQNLHADGGAITRSLGRWRLERQRRPVDAEPIRARLNGRRMAAAEWVHIGEIVVTPNDLPRW